MTSCMCGFVTERSALGCRKCPRCLTTTNKQTRQHLDDTRKLLSSNGKDTWFSTRRTGLNPPQEHHE